MIGFAKQENQKNMQSKKQKYILSLQCPDQVGIVAAVSAYLASQNGWILEADYHSDEATGMFYMRQEILAESLKCDFETLKNEFAPIAQKFNIEWSLTDSHAPKNVVILISKQDHCLNDLLHRYRMGNLNCNIPCVISNHEDNRDFVEWHGIPFFYVPMTKDNKAEAFKEIESIYQNHNGDVMVLARFMQILPADLTEKYHGQIINIHHSFLPSFIGGKPYHQAYERGVKLIGATCHYATKDLDQGPIIEQDVIRIDHSHTIKDMIELGRDVEKTVLARALKQHLENRVMIYKNKTVVFS